MDGVVLVGSCCRLVPLVPEDAPAWFAAMRRSRVRFGQPASASVSAARRAIGVWQASWRELGPLRLWSIRPGVGDRLLGAVAVEDAGDGERAVRLEYHVISMPGREEVAADAALLALDYAAREMDATHATMPLGDRRTEVLAVARRLGASVVRRATDEGGDAIVVTRLDLPLAT